MSVPDDANRPSKRKPRLALMGMLLGVSTVLAIVGAMQGIGGVWLFPIGLAMGVFAAGFVRDALARSQSANIDQADERTKSSLPTAVVGFSLGITATTTIIVAVEAGGGAAALFLVALLVGAAASDRLPGRR